jgi:hypothetical protein
VQAPRLRAAGREKGREGERRGEGGNGRGDRYRDEKGRLAEEMTGRSGEDHQQDQRDCRDRARGPGFTAHGQSLFARAPPRVGRTSLPSNTWIAHLERKVKAPGPPAASVA